MSEVNNLGDYLTGLADAIREKTGDTSPMSAQTFASAILGISGEIPALNNLTISINGNTLYITNPTTNGDFVEGFNIYANGVQVGTQLVAETTFDLTVLEQGSTYLITAGAYSTNFTESTSNEVSYNSRVFYITYTLTNVTGDPSNPDYIPIYDDRTTLLFTADAGYSLPDSVSVSGASYTWDKLSGSLVISGPVSQIVITITAEPQQTGYNVSFTSGGLSFPQMAFYSIDNGDSWVDFYSQNSPNFRQLENVTDIKFMVTCEDDGSAITGGAIWIEELGLDINAAYYEDTLISPEDGSYTLTNSVSGYVYTDTLPY